MRGLRNDTMYLNCKDCIHYETSDKSCNKTSNLFLNFEDSLMSWKKCSFFKLCDEAYFYDDKSKQFSDYRLKHPIVKTPGNNNKITVENYYSLEELRKKTLIICNNKKLFPPKNCERKHIKLMLENGEEINSYIYIKGDNAYIKGDYFPEKVEKAFLKLFNKRIWDS
jgi:hypothetical protein